MNNYNIDDNEIITVNEVANIWSNMLKHMSFTSGNQVWILNSSAAVYREAVSIMPLESNTIQSGKADIAYDLWVRRPVYRQSHNSRCENNRLLIFMPAYIKHKHICIYVPFLSAENDAIIFRLSLIRWWPDIFIWKRKGKKEWRRKDFLHYYLCW